MHEFFAALRGHAAEMPERVALVAPETTLTWRELAERAGRAARWAECLPRRVGLLCGKSVDGFVADVALAFAGRETVPLPDFFAAGQLAHIVDAAGLDCVVADPASLARAGDLGVSAVALEAAAEPLASPRAGARRIIFTSGTTGAPKGVRLGPRQIGASAAALVAAIGAGPADRYLSLLPPSLLLEQIAGIYAPLLAGAAVHLAAPGAGRLDDAAMRAGATVTVLVPELLAAWVREREESVRPAAASLRFVAVGGAPVPPALADKAWRLGLPVHEGYGLSECGSVVALNRPGERVAGTVGRPLEGVAVTIEAGEVVVAAPTVMDGYLGAADTPPSWRTGDLGALDAAGRLTIAGRKDNVLVTGAGRNVSPEWIESLIGAGPGIGRCVLTLREGALVAVLTPAPGADPALFAAPRLGDRVARLCAAAPDYARPRAYLLLEEEELRRHGLLTANGWPRRTALGALLAAAEPPALLHPVARNDVAF